MLRLIETHFTSTGEPDHGDGTPSGFLHVRTPDTLRRKCRYLGLEIVTHEIEFVPVILFGGMNCHFRRRQREDEPSMASIHGRESENLAEKGAISRRILAVNDDMGSKDHERFSFFHIRPF